jgi:ribosomal protein L7Ae-like RNA K-turn-binding protein
MNNLWMQQLHFVIRAQAYLTGELGKRALSTKKVHYMIIASDTSLAHQTLLIERLNFYKIPYVITLNQATLNQMTKKKQVAFLAITNASLAKTLIEKETPNEKNTNSSSRKYTGKPGEN